MYIIPEYPNKYNVYCNKRITLNPYAGIIKKIQSKQLINNNDKTEPANPTIIPVLMCDCDSFLYLNVK